MAPSFADATTGLEMCGSALARPGPPRGRVAFMEISEGPVTRAQLVAAADAHGRKAAALESEAAVLLRRAEKHRRWEKKCRADADTMTNPEGNMSAGGCT